MKENVQEFLTLFCFFPFLLEVCSGVCIDYISWEWLGTKQETKFILIWVKKKKIKMSLPFFHCLPMGLNYSHMSIMMSHITGNLTVGSTYCSANIKHNIKPPKYWPFVRGLLTSGSPRKAPVMQKVFPCHDVIMSVLFSQVHATGNIAIYKYLSNF